MNHPIASDLCGSSFPSPLVGEGPRERASIFLRWIARRVTRHSADSKNPSRQELKKTKMTRRTPQNAAESRRTPSIAVCNLLAHKVLGCRGYERKNEDESPQSSEPPCIATQASPPWAGGSTPARTYAVGSLSTKSKFSTTSVCRSGCRQTARQSAMISPSPFDGGVHPEGISLDPEIFGIEGHPQGDTGGEVVGAN